MAANQALVAKLYRGVIEDVIGGVRDSFLDEGVDEAVLQELKQIWESKLTASKAIEPLADPAETQIQNKVQQSQQSNASSSASNQSATQPGSAQNKQATGNSSATPSSGATPSSAGAAAGTPMPVKLVPVQITVPAQPGVANSVAKSITVQVPAHALQGGTAGAQLQSVLSSPAVTAALQLPVEIATSVLQTQIDNALRSNTVRSQTGSKGTDNGGVTQLDGANGSSSDEDDVDDDDDDDLEEDEDKDDEEHDEDNEENQEEEPLNSEDDVSDEDPSALFETDNVVVCQYDKITRSRNRWKFHLKDGIMNINGRDYVFQKANGDAEW